MARAVHFNGAQLLTNTRLGELPDFTSKLYGADDLIAGIFFYWYRADTPVSCAMVLAYSNSRGNHCLRITHNKFGYFGAHVLLQLQRAGSLSSDNQNVSLMGKTPLPFDGKWHHVWITWTTNFKQLGYAIHAQMVLDGGSPMELTQHPPREEFPEDAGFSIDYSVADVWQIGGERGENLLGDLAEVYLQIKDFWVESNTLLQGMSPRFMAYLPSIGATASLSAGPGRGFIEVGSIDLSTAVVTPHERFTATEIDADGSGALGVLGLAPQIYLTIPPGGTDPNHFAKNVTGLAPRVFDTVGGVPSLAASDPF